MSASSLPAAPTLAVPPHPYLPTSHQALTWHAACLQDLRVTEGLAQMVVLSETYMQVYGRKS